MVQGYGIKGSLLASMFFYQVFDISNHTNYKFFKISKFFCVCISHEKKIPSFSAFVIVMKKFITGMIELCLHACVCVRVRCSTSSAKSKIMGEKGMSQKTPLIRQVKRVSSSISFNIFIPIF